MSDAKVVGDRDGNGFKLFDQSVLFSFIFTAVPIDGEWLVTLGCCGPSPHWRALNIVNDRSDVTVDALWPQNIQRYRKYTARPQ